MADAGVADDILLTYNVLGEAKAERLMALIRRLKRMAVVLDNETVARGLSEAGKRHGVDIRFLIECDTGFARNGVQSRRPPSISRDRRCAYRTCGSKD